jgi:hypothetical protein
MRTAILTAALAVTAIATAACSSGSSQGTGTATDLSTASASPLTFCAAYCGRRAECDRDVDKQTCERTCENDADDTVGKLRGDVMESTRACYSGSDCKAVLSGNRLVECIDEAAVSVAPGDSAKRFCDSLIDAGRRCDVTFDRAKCLGLFKLYSDKVLDAATKCTSKSCSAIPSCVDAETDLGE